MRILSTSELVPTPWPNQKGITYDVAESRLSNGERDWLISIAELSQDAPFSHFENCDRVFTLLGDGKIELAIDPAPPMPCFPLVPVLFAGDVAAYCRVGSPTRTFNLFMNRAGTPLKVSVLMIGPRQNVVRTDPIVALYCAVGEITLGSHTLQQEHTAIALPQTYFQAGRRGAAVILIEAVGA